ncbi:MAG: TetR/AcrR family transcriptional regulator [Anaeroplasmataceae bacterium]
MYELKSNKKSLESQKIIYKALRQLLLTKPLNEITVKDICTSCGVSRATFYRNFNNVCDVLSVMLEFFYNRYLNERVNHSNQLLFFFEYWYYHRDLINIITTQNENILKDCMKRHFNKENNIYINNLKFSILSSLLCTWSKSKKETPKEMEELTRDILQNKCLDILLEF